MTETVEIKENVLKLADNLRKDAKVEGNQVVFAKDAFKENLPEGLTLDAVKQTKHYEQEFAAAQTLVTGELAVKHFKANKDVSEVKSTVRLPVGKSVAVIQREAQFRNPSTGETTSSFAHASTRIQTAVSGSTVVAIRARIAKLAKEAGLAK